MGDERYARLAAALGELPATRLVYAFGSAARGETGPRSDVDVAVLLARALTWDEERELRARVAVAVPEADLVVLNDAGPVLRHEVVTTGRCLLARDEREQAEFEILTLSRYLDFEPMRRVQREYLRARVEERRGSPARRPS